MIGQRAHSTSVCRWRLHENVSGSKLELPTAALPELRRPVGCPAQPRYRSSVWEGATQSADVALLVERLNRVDATRKPRTA